MRTVRRAGMFVVVAMSVMATPASAATTQVSVAKAGFNPDPVTINQGDTVSWTWTDTFQHNIASGTRSAPDNAFPGTDFYGQGHVYAYQFNTPGIYHYYCIPHAYMNGTITVVGPDTAPTARFAFSPASPAAGRTVTFDGTASSDTDFDAVPDYAWDFGDNTTGTGPKPTHTYAAGTYTVKLTVTDARRTSSAPVTQTITVRTSLNTAPKADFRVSPMPAQVGDQLTFAASASDIDGDSIAGYRWSFGDGSRHAATSGRTLVHAFKAAGRFRVGLLAIDSHGLGSPAVRHVVRVLATSPAAPRITRFAITPSNLCARRSSKCKLQGAHLRIQLTKQAAMTLKITSASSGEPVGKPIKVAGRRGQNDVKLPGSGLTPGLYFLTGWARNSFGRGPALTLRFRVLAS